MFLESSDYDKCSVQHSYTFFGNSTYLSPKGCSGGDYISSASLLVAVVVVVVVVG